MIIAATTATIRSAPNAPIPFSYSGQALNRSVVVTSTRAFARGEGMVHPGRGLALPAGRTRLPRKSRGGGAHQSGGPLSVLGEGGGIGILAPHDRDRGRDASVRGYSPFVPHSLCAPSRSTADSRRPTHVTARAVAFMNARSRVKSDRGVRTPVSGRHLQCGCDPAWRSPGPAFYAAR